MTATTGRSPGIPGIREEVGRYLRPVESIRGRSEDLGVVEFGSAGHARDSEGAIVGGKNVG